MLSSHGYSFVWGKKTDFQKKERNIFELEIGRYSFLLMPLIQLFEISLPCSIKVSLSLETDMIIGQTGLEKKPSLLPYSKAENI